MTKESQKAISVDPLLLKETAEAQQRLAHLIERLVPYLGLAEKVRKMGKWREI